MCTTARAITRKESGTCKGVGQVHVRFSEMYSYASERLVLLLMLVSSSMAPLHVSVSMKEIITTYQSGLINLRFVWCHKQKSQNFGDADGA